jgi:SAM-dependent methyltransferase
MNGAREARDREHFDSIAISYAAKDLAPSTRRARLRRVERTIAAAPVESYDRVLEVGCGAGFASRYLSGRCHQYIGIDHSQRLIELAVEENAADGVRFEASSIDDFEPPWSLDLIFMIGVLHHLENRTRTMEIMMRWLEPGGYLIANEPQPANPLFRTARKARSRFDASYSSEQEEISAAELRTLFEDAGLENVTITPQGFMSTPFAELILRPFAVTTPLARVACAVDGLLEKRPLPWFAALSWNLIGCGRAPSSR